MRLSRLAGREPVPQEFTAANPLSSAPSPDRFRQMWPDILLD